MSNINLKDQINFGDDSDEYLVTPLSNGK